MAASKTVLTQMEALPRARLVVYPSTSMGRTRDIPAPFATAQPHYPRIGLARRTFVIGAQWEWVVAVVGKCCRAVMLRTLAE
ncbi:hypothetical protein GCM10009563_05150 [Subtercola frigoramans]